MNFVQFAQACGVLIDNLSQAIGLSGAALLRIPGPRMAPTFGTVIVDGYSHGTARPLFSGSTTLQ